MRTVEMIARAFVVGLRDGWGEPWDLTVGMTYRDERAQAAWDHGANVGQWLGRKAATRTNTNNAGGK